MNTRPAIGRLADYIDSEQQIPYWVSALAAVALANHIDRLKLLDDDDGDQEATKEHILDRLEADLAPLLALDETGVTA